MIGSFFAEYLENEMRKLRHLIPSTLLTSLSLIASAQDYPVKTIRVITPYGVGGASDIVVRAGVQEMSKELGQSVVVENRTGGGATIGFTAFATSPADGYTLLGTASSLHGIAAVLYRDTLKHDPNKDVEPIIVFANVSNVLVVNPSINVKSTKELIELAKTRPGKLTFVSAGVGTSVHMAGELFKKMAEVQMTHVPYKSSVAALVDLMAGRVDVMFDNIPSALPHIKSGQTARARHHRCQARRDPAGAADHRRARARRLRSRRMDRAAGAGAHSEAHHHEAEYRGAESRHGTRLREAHGGARLRGGRRHAGAHAGNDRCRGEDLAPDRPSLGR
jgi:tripartite-type tricarboxylate transporter receptor subunit TctC